MYSIRRTTERQRQRSRSPFCYERKCIIAWGGELMDREVISINRQRVFTLADANVILPVVRRITAEFSQKVESVVARLQSMDGKQTDLVAAMECEVNETIKQWYEKMKKLGAVPKGLWLVDFDCGDGYFCWKFPEASILYWHEYQDGFTGRLPIESYLNRKVKPLSLESEAPISPL